MNTENNHTENTEATCTYETCMTCPFTECLTGIIARTRSRQEYTEFIEDIATAYEPPERK